MSNRPAITIPPDVYRKYQELQRYVGWSESDAGHVRAAYRYIEPHLDALIDDFYEELQRHPAARQVIVGGAQQIETLKVHLRGWLQELFAGTYDETYVQRRWRVGWRHVEIGLDQVYASSAMSRLRMGMLDLLHRHWKGSRVKLRQSTGSLNRLIDLDLAVISDAYQRQRVADEKQRSETVFRNLVEAARCVIVILRPNHQIAYINPYTEQLTGHQADRSLGRDFARMFVSQEERDKIDQQIDRVLRQKLADHRFEISVMCRDGQQRWISWDARILDDYQGGLAILVIGHDLTDRRQAEDRALRSERLAAIGQMVTGLAHESRNAFQRSQACLELLELELEGQDEALDLVRRIQNAQNHLHHLYEEVRDYAAPIRVSRDECHLSQVWRETWANLEMSRDDRQIAFREIQTIGDTVVHADPHAIEQLLRNVLENAIDACGAAGEITLRCQDARIGSVPAIRLSIADSGPGFDPSSIDRVFEPFYTTKTKGTGLGMAIAQRIVEAHGGQIFLSNRRGGGGKVSVILPRYRSPKRVEG
jgi:PAS domain S-box-containing protein